VAFYNPNIKHGMGYLLVAKHANFKATDEKQLIILNATSNLNGYISRVKSV
jgi:hypothetical protein